MASDLRTRLLRVVAGLMALAALVLVPASPASAHTDFDYSIPAADEIVAEPVGEITIVYTLPVTLVGNGFEVLTPQGDVLAPQATTSDDTVYVLAFDEPLAGGVVAVRWEVAAADGHPLSGAFTFTVDAVPAAEEPPATAAASAESIATVAPVETEADGAPIESVQATVPTTEPVVSTTAPSAMATHSADAADMEASPSTVADESDGGSGGDSNTDLYLAALASLAMGVGAFTVLRPTAGA